MKFGNYLENNKNPAWRNDYIEYNQLKYYLKDTQLSVGWTSEHENFFIESLFSIELTKVQQFIQIKIYQMKEMNQDPKLQENINNLINFIHLNNIGFRKILKKHDKWTGINQSFRYSSITHQFDSYINQLNKMSAQIPTVKKYVIQKYWIHPDNLKEVEAILLFNLPIKSSNNTQQKDELVNSIYFDNPSNLNLYSEFLERRNLSETICTKWYGVTSEQSNVKIEKKIYHESWVHNKEMYSNHSIQLPYSEISSFISTGLAQAPPLAQELYEKSKKLCPIIRCSHNRKTFQDNQPLHITLDTNVTLSKETTDPIWKKTDYQPDKNDLYIFPFSVMKIKIHMANDDQQLPPPLPQWLEQLTKSRLIYEVPYFSRYLHGISHFFWERVTLLPWWTNEMEKDIRYANANLSNQSSIIQSKCIIIEPSLIPDYSHNITEQLRPESIKASDQITHDSSCTIVNTSHHDVHSKDRPREIPNPERYGSPFENKFKELKSNYYDDPNVPDDQVGMRQWMYAKITRDKKLLDEQPDLSISFKKGKKKKIEPKIFFANERTFISWLQFSALLMAVSLGLINFGDHISRGSGAFFITVAIVLAIYAQLRFQYRTWQIRFRSEDRFDDMLGPAILCVVLVIALFVNLGLRLNQPLPENPSLFGYNSDETTFASYSAVNPRATATVSGYSQYPTPTTARTDRYGRVTPVDEEDENEPDENEP